METLLNDRMLLVFLLNKFRNLYDKDHPINMACKTACMVLSHQIMSIRLKENLIGTLDLKDEESLLSKETFKNTEYLELIKKYFNRIDSVRLVKYESSLSDPSFSNMSNIMLTGSIKIIIDHLEYN